MRRQTLIKSINPDAIAATSEKNVTDLQAFGACRDAGIDPGAINKINSREKFGEWYAPKAVANVQAQAAVFSEKIEATADLVLSILREVAHDTSTPEKLAQAAQLSAQLANSIKLLSDNAAEWSGTLLKCAELQGSTAKKETQQVKAPRLFARNMQIVINDDKKTEQTNSGSVPSEV